MQGKSHGRQNRHREMRRSRRHMKYTLHKDRKCDANRQAHDRESAACGHSLWNNMHANNPGNRDDDERIHCVPYRAVLPAQGVNNRPEQQSKCTQQEIHD